MASGTKENEIPWHVGIQSPRQQNPGLLAKFNVFNQAVATSGDYIQFFSNDFRNHHILNPHTGYSSSQIASTTVLAPTCMQADAYATALMVMDVQQGIDLIETLEGIEAYIVTKQLETLTSSGFSA